MHRALSSRRVLSALLPAATAAFAAAIFVAELMTSEKLTAALFYVLVVLLAAFFCNARGVVLVGVGCAGLTLLSFLLPGVPEPLAPGFKAFVSVAVIGLTTFLVAERRRAMEALRESEERWRAMFETARVGIATLDFDHRRYLTVNASFQADDRLYRRRAAKSHDAGAYSRGRSGCDARAYR